MTQTLHAVFDGKVLKPEEPLKFPAYTRVQITVKKAATRKKKRSGPSFLELVRSLKIEGPPDWSARLEDYLYGDKTPPDA